MTHNNVEYKLCWNHHKSPSQTDFPTDEKMTNIMLMAQTIWRISMAAADGQVSKFRLMLSNNSRVKDLNLLYDYIRNLDMQITRMHKE